MYFRIFIILLWSYIPKITVYINTFFLNFEDIIHTHLKQSSCIILGIDIIKKKELYTIRHFFRDQHNCKLSSEIILTLTQCKLPINSKYIL